MAPRVKPSHGLITAIIALLIAIAGLLTAIENGGTTTVVRHAAAVPAVAGDQQSPVPLKDDTPAGVNPRQIEKGVAESQRAQHPAPENVGGAQTYSCKSLYGGHLWSSRNSVRPTEFVLHYTAGNGTAESIDSYFRSTRAASATYLLEPSGHCRREVPESDKPWTQLAANSTSISVEIVTTGWNVSRAQWLAMPIFRKGILADLMRDAMKRHGIPLRYVDPLGCDFKPGYTDHDHLECGNDHTDVLPHFPWDVLKRQLHHAVDVHLAPARAAKACAKLNLLRARHPLHAYGRRTKVKLGRYFYRGTKHRLHEHGSAFYTCSRHGAKRWPVKH